MLRTDFINEPLLLVPPRHCITVQCINSTLSDDWIEVTNYICYIILPVILILGLLAQIINVIVLANQIRLSLDTYFFILSLTTAFHVCTSIIIALPHYINCIHVLINLIYYSILVHQWTQYIIVWIILSVALERTLTVTLYQTYNQVSPVQSWIISALVICIGCVSTIPLCWQYDIVNHHNHTQNVTDNYVIQKTGNYEEYDTVYFWYITCIFTGLPILLMLVTTTGLCTSIHTFRNNSVNSKCRTSTALILNRRFKEEIRLTKLIIRFMLLYTILMFPWILFNCLYFLNVLDMDDPVCITLSNILCLWYNTFFIVQQQLYFCYNKQYRLTFISLFCCFC